MAFARAAFAAGMLAVASSASAQTFPNRPITMVVPFAAGGTTDVVARLMADTMSRSLGQQVIVENVTGAGGTVGATRVKRAAADGYTILMGNLGTQSASVGIYGDKLQYDPRTDFDPIINTGGTPMYVLTKKDFPAKDFKEFAAYLKANAGKMNYGSGGVGATSHLTCLYLHSLLGVTVTHVPFRGSGPAMQALMGGQIDYVCDQSVAAVPVIQSKDLPGLVVASANRQPQTPDVPTSAQQGLPGFIVSGWNAMFAPKGTPKEALDKLQAAALKALDDETIKKRFLDLGIEMPAVADRTPAALLAHVAAEVDKWTPVVKAAGVTGN
ncbi:MAG: tripartite tricarboxylate transporter substrate-binding protein [Beijerinckiaceae bacterium]